MDAWSVCHDLVHESPAGLLALIEQVHELQ